MKSENCIRSEYAAISLSRYFDVRRDSSTSTKADLVPDEYISSLSDPRKWVTIRTKRSFSDIPASRNRRSILELAGTRPAARVASVFKIGGTNPINWEKRISIL